MESCLQMKVMEYVKMVGYKIRCLMRPAHDIVLSYMIEA